MAAKDTHPFLNMTPHGPFENHFDVTPDDANELPILPLYIYVEVAGTVAIRGKNGTDCTYNLPAHAVLPFRGRRILATGTTATGIKGRY